MREETSKDETELGLLVICCWAYSLPFRAFCFPSEIPLEPWRKLNFHLKVVINWRLLLG